MHEVFYDKLDPVNQTLAICSSLSAKDSLKKNSLLCISLSTGRIKESHLQGLYCSISYILYTINNLQLRQNFKHCCCYACVKPNLTMEACFFLGIKNKKVIATMSPNVTFYPKNESVYCNSKYISNICESISFNCDFKSQNVTSYFVM